jgi:hypothetical protein
MVEFIEWLFVRRLTHAQPISHTSDCQDQNG